MTRVVKVHLRIGAGVWNELVAHFDNPSHAGAFLKKATASKGAARKAVDLSPDEG